MHTHEHGQYTCIVFTCIEAGVLISYIGVFDATPTIGIGVSPINTQAFIGGRSLFEWGFYTG